MKKLLLIIVSLLLISSKSFAGELFLSNDIHDTSAFKIFEVKSRDEADIVIYVTKSKLFSMNKDEIWTYSADSTKQHIVFVDVKWHGEKLKVYFTTNKEEAKWMFPKRKYFGKLGANILTD